MVFLFVSMAVGFLLLMDKNEDIQSLQTVLRVADLDKWVEIVGKAHRHIILCQRCKSTSCLHDNYSVQLVRVSLCTVQAVSQDCMYATNHFYVPRYILSSLAKLFIKSARKKKHGNLVRSKISLSGHIQTLAQQLLPLMIRLRLTICRRRDLRGGACLRSRKAGSGGRQLP